MQAWQQWVGGTARGCLWTAAARSQQLSSCLHTPSVQTTCMDIETEHAPASPAVAGAAAGAGAGAATGPLLREAQTASTMHLERASRSKATTTGAAGAAAGAGAGDAAAAAVRPLLTARPPLRLLLQLLRLRLLPRRLLLRSRDPRALNLQSRYPQRMPLPQRVQDNHSTGWMPCGQLAAPRTSNDWR
jgi:hypothetical protein